MNVRTDELEHDLEARREHFRRTVDELETRLSPGRLLDEVLQALDYGPKEMTQNLGRQLRDKPLPLALTTIGLVWTMASDGAHAHHGDGRREHGDDHANGDYANGYGDHLPTEEEIHGADLWDRHQEATWLCVREEGESDEAYRDRLAQARGDALSISRRDDEDHHSFSDRVEKASRESKKMAASYRDKMKNAAHAASGRAKRVAHAAGAGLSSAAHGASSAAHSVSHGISGGVAQAKHLHEDHPLASGALGLAIGALIGSALPLSRAEEEKMRGLADRGLAAGADAARDAAASVKDTAQDVRRFATSES